MENGYKEVEEEKFENMLKSGLGMGNGSSFGSNSSSCMRSKKSHKKPYRLRAIHV